MAKSAWHVGDCLAGGRVHHMVRRAWHVAAQCRNETRTYGTVKSTFNPSKRVWGRRV